VDANAFLVNQRERKRIQPLNHRVSNPFKLNACSVKTVRNMKAPSPERLLDVSSTTPVLHRRPHLLEPSLVFREMKLLPHLSSLQSTLRADQPLFEGQRFLVLSPAMLENILTLLTRPLALSRTLIRSPISRSSQMLLLINSQVQVSNLAISLRKFLLKYLDRWGLISMRPICGICLSEVFLKTCYDKIFFGIGQAKLFDLLILVCGSRYSFLLS
jgi:hypothetical protein